METADLVNSNRCRSEMENRIWFQRERSRERNLERENTELQEGILHIYMCLERGERREIGNARLKNETETSGD